MMMVPRSFAHAQAVREASSKSKSKKPHSSPITSRSPSPRSSLVVEKPAASVVKEKQVAPTTSAHAQKKPQSSQPRQRKVSRPAPSPVKIPKPTSAPMVIPARKNGHESQSMNPRTPPRRTKAGRHVTIPPAVAALLAGTAIPPPKGRNMNRSRSAASIPRRISMEHLKEEWKKDSSASSSFGRGSPLDFLLEPAEDTDGSGDDLDKEPESLPSRSISSDSIYSSTPSLNADEDLASPSFSSPATPSSLRRNPRFDRKEKLSLTPTTECQDHPLQHIPIPEDSILSTPEPTPIPTQSRSKPRSSLKSNLTASFQAIKSAARAFSNFTAPSLPSDDFLTRSLFSSKYASEMRPRDFAGGVPDASLRRYLNPTTAAVPSSAVMTDFHTLLTDSLWVRESDGKLHSQDVSKRPTPSPMIQLQTYVRVSRSPSPRIRSRSSSPLPPLPAPERAEFPLAAVGPDGSLAIVRHREPRENSDFLRVIVLEMNMRRVGKLDAKAAGRARVWLPPRRMSVVVETVGRNSADEKDDSGRAVPERWIGVTAEEI